MKLTSIQAAIVGIVGILGPQSIVSAAFTLEYTGPTFTTINGSPGVTTSDRITATITLKPSITALTSGLPINDPDIDDFMVSAGPFTATKSGSAFWNMALSIGPSGLPQEWFILVEQDVTGAASPEQWAASRFAIPPLSLQDIFAIDDTFPGSSSVNVSTAAIVESFDPSAIPTTTWTTRVVPNPIPAPGAFALVLTGVASLSGLRRRMKRSAAV